MINLAILDIFGGPFWPILAVLVPNLAFTWNSTNLDEIQHPTGYFQYISKKIIWGCFGPKIGHFWPFWCQIWLSLEIQPIWMKFNILLDIFNIFPKKKFGGVFGQKLAILVPNLAFTWNSTNLDEIQHPAGYFQYISQKIICGYFWPKIGHFLAHLCTKFGFHLKYNQFRWSSTSCWIFSIYF